MAYYVDQTCVRGLQPKLGPAPVVRTSAGSFTPFAAPAFAEIAAYTARQLQIPQVTSGVTTTAVRAETAVTTTTTTTLAPESQDG